MPYHFAFCSPHYHSLVVRRHALPSRGALHDVPLLGQVQVAPVAARGLVRLALGLGSQVSTGSQSKVRKDTSEGQGARRHQIGDTALSARRWVWGHV